MPTAGMNGGGNTNPCPPAAHHRTALHNQRQALERALALHAASGIGGGTSGSPLTSLASGGGRSPSPYAQDKQAGAQAAKPWRPAAKPPHEVCRALYEMGMTGLDDELIDHGCTGASLQEEGLPPQNPASATAGAGVRDAVDYEVRRMRALQWMRSVDLPARVADAFAASGASAHMESALLSCVRSMDFAPHAPPEPTDPPSAHTPAGGPKFALEAAGLRACGVDWAPAERVLDRLLGLPGAEVADSIRLEHCEGGRSHETFTSHEFGFRTTPLEEFEYVDSPSADKVYPGEHAKKGPGRSRRSVDELVEDERAKAVGLSREEVLALRLCTGPMKEVYNEVIKNACEGRGIVPRLGNYATTIHTIVGAVKKLGQADKTGSMRPLYIGLEGEALPEALTRINEIGMRCGCESMGFITASTRREMAVQWSGKRSDPSSGLPPLALEFSLGQTCRGASVEWLSQSVVEQGEVLLPPLSYLELQGDPRLETTAGAEVVVLPLTVVTPKTFTVAEIAGRRKQLHVSTVSHILEETRREMLKREKTLRGRQASVLRGEGLSGGVLEEILSECESRLVQLGHREVSWYDDDAKLKEGMTDAVDMKRLALLKHSIAVEHAVRSSETRVIERIKGTPIEELNVDANVRRLRSGVEDFPWKEVSEQTREEVRMPKDVEVWQASMLWEFVWGVRESVMRVRFGGVVLSDFAEPNIKLANTNIGLSGAKVVAGLLHTNRNISCVCLPGNAIGPDGAMAIAQSLSGTSRLVELDLSANQIKGQEAVSIILTAVQGNTSLTSIDLRSNGLSFQDGLLLHGAIQQCASVKYVCGLPMQLLRKGGLTDLDLQEKGMGPAEAALAIEALRVNTSVTRLNLAGTRMGAQGAERLVSLLESTTVLRTLDLRFNDLSYGDGLALVPALQAPTCPVRSLSGVPLQALRDGNITELSLRSMNVGPAEGAIAISLLARCTNLTKLSLFGVGVGEQGLRDLLPFLRNGQQLRLLDLRDNGLGKELGHEVYDAVRGLPYLRNVCGIPYDGLLKGSVKSIELEGMSIGPGESVILIELLRANTTVTHLDLRGSGIDDESLGELMPFLDGNTALTHLDLRGNALSFDSGSLVNSRLGPHIEMVSAVPVKAMRENTVIDLDLGGDKKIGLFGGSIAVGMLKHNTSLSKLSLAGVGMGKRGLKEVLDFLRKTNVLTNLDLRGNDLTLSDGRQLLVALGQRKHEMQFLSGVPLAGMLVNAVQELDLSKRNPPVGAAEIGILCEALKLCTSLTHLDVSENGNFGDGAVSSLMDALGKVPHLSLVDLRGNELTATQGELLIKSMGAESSKVVKMCGIPVAEVREGTLTELALYYKNLGPLEGVVLGDALKGAQQVTTLDLTRNFIGPEGAVSLAASLGMLVNLKELGLGGNGIMEEGGLAIAERLNNLTALERLYLYENELGPTGSEAIAQSLRGLGQLQQLYLSYNSMGDIGCCALCTSLPTLTKLECIGLQHNEIGIRGWEDFATALDTIRKVKYVNIQGQGLDGEDHAELAARIRQAVMKNAANGKVMVYM